MLQLRMQTVCAYQSSSSPESKLSSLLLLSILLLASSVIVAFASATSSSSSSSSNNNYYERPEGGDTRISRDREDISEPARTEFYHNVPDQQTQSKQQESATSLSSSLLAQSEKNGANEFHPSKRTRNRRLLVAPQEEHCPKGAAIFGLRCDEGGELQNGSLVIKANTPTKLMLIGRQLSSDVAIALTPTIGSTQIDCTHTDRVKSLQMENLSSNVALVEIDLPSPGSNVPFYLCLRETNNKEESRWFHQGTEAWLRIYVKQDILPLYMKIFVIACLLLLSGLFSGLNLGLMALDKNELQVIISCGSEREKRYARAIEPVRRRGNYLLCSILFSNVLVNSTIAVLLEELTSGIVAVMTSTIFIVMFGEILPQAFCSRHGLAVGAKTVSITYFCMIVTFPLSYPVSFCLDWALGEEIGHAYDRERLMEFIRVTRDYNNLETDEVNIISGALKLKRIQLMEVMTRIEDVYMLDVNSQLDFDTIQAIIEKGYSRIPVHEANNKKNIVALLFAKDLALLDPDDRTPVQTMISFYNHPIMYLFEDTTLDSALNEFKTGKSHMAFVRRVQDDGDRDPVYEITGVVTLEDVIEEIMQMEINDETDILSDNRRKRRRKEAQVRKDFSQFTNLGQGDSSHNVVTPQLRMAAYQYLATTIEPFMAKNISDSILKRLLSQKIYYKVRAEDPQAERCLYNAGEPADYFIMILEGRVQVACGRESLAFGGGPFAHFGEAALFVSELEAVEQQAAELVTRKISTNKKELTDLLDSQQQPGRTISGQFSISMRKLEPDLDETERMYNMLNSSTGKDSSAPLLGSSIKLKASSGSVQVLSGSSDGHKIANTCHQSQHFFVPDYTVEVMTNCSYLKVTRQEYLTAFRATLVERGAAEIELGDTDQTN